MSHNPNEISVLASELVFREIPGTSAHRWRRSQWLGRLVLVALADPMGGRVAGVAGAPTGLCLLAAGLLPVRLTAGALAVADPVERDSRLPLPGFSEVRPMGRLVASPFPQNACRGKYLVANVFTRRPEMLVAPQTRCSPWFHRAPLIRAFARVPTSTSIMLAACSRDPQLVPYRMRTGRAPPSRASQDSGCHQSLGHRGWSACKARRLSLRILIIQIEVIPLGVYEAPKRGGPCDS